MWLLLLLCLLPLAAAKQWVEVGTNATVALDGSTDHPLGGCKFLLQNSSGVITCCFSLASQLCGPGTQGSSCRERGSYTVEEEPDRCVLRLPDFQLSDTGTYRAVFPDRLADSSDVEVEAVKTGKVGPLGPAISVIILVIIGLVVVLIIMRLKQDKEKCHRYAKIIGPLYTEGDDLSDRLWRRNILSVQNKQNRDTVYHLAARSDWTDEQTSMVFEEIQQSRTVCDDIEIIHEEENNVAIPRTKTDIFRVTIVQKIPTRFPKLILLKWIMPRSANLNCRNNQGETPLIIACSQNQPEVAQVLLQQNVDAEVIDNKESNALHHAININSKEIVNMLLSHGLSPNSLNKQNCQGETGLILACRLDQPENVEALLDRDVDVELVDSRGSTALHHAVREGFTPIAERLLAHGDGWRGSAMSLVYLAVAGRRKEALELLLLHGANSDGRWRLEDGTTCIWRAVEEGNPGAVRLLKDRMEESGLKEDMDAALKLAKNMKENFKSEKNTDDFMTENMNDIVFILSHSKQVNAIANELKKVNIGSVFKSKKIKPVSTTMSAANPESTDNISSARSFKMAAISASSLAFAAQRAFANKLTNSNKVVTLLDERSSLLLEGLKSLLLAYSGNKKESEETIQNIIKIAVKIMMLMHGDKFNDVEKAQLEEVQEALMDTSMIVVRVHREEQPFDGALLTAQLVGVERHLRGLVSCHLSESSVSRVEQIFSVVKASHFLESILAPGRTPELSELVEALVEGLVEDSVM